MAPAALRLLPAPQPRPPSAPTTTATWLEQHLEALSLALARTRALLLEGQACRDLLRHRLEELGEVPGERHGPVLAGDHAWELSHPAIREHRGLA